MSFRELINRGVPIIQAPMAGGINTPELVAAVANAGAIGSFGFAYSSPQKIAADLQAARQLTDRIINANFFVFSEPEQPTAEACQSAIHALEHLTLSVEQPYRMPESPFYPSLQTQLESVWQHPPDILTFHFGLPEVNVIERAHSLGILVGVTATCVEEALQIQQAGADFVVAQSIDAGGHRGTFSPAAEGDECLSTIELLASLSDVDMPIVPAGGIMHGEDIRECLDRGAAAVQMGTAFLCCTEAGTGKVYRRYLLEEQTRPTVFTRAFSGRRAQAIEVEFTREMDGKPVLPFPLQNTLTGPLRDAAFANGNGEYQSFWAGTGFARIREMPAADLVAALVREMSN